MFTTGEWAHGFHKIMNLFQLFATAVGTRESSQPERISPSLLMEPYVTLSRHTALDHSFDARSKYQWTNSFGYSFLTRQLSLSLPVRKSVFRQHPLEQT